MQLRFFKVKTLLNNAFKVKYEGMKTLQSYAIVKLKLKFWYSETSLQQGPWDHEITCYIRFLVISG